jgi:hypothetical protein
MSDLEFVLIYLAGFVLMDTFILLWSSRWGTDELEFTEYLASTLASLCWPLVLLAIVGVLPAVLVSKLRRRK